VLGGGPTLDRSCLCTKYLDLDLPVLGICLGLHIIAIAHGGAVQKGTSGGYGSVQVNICDHDAILAGYPDQIQVWASHADEVATVPEGFTILASSPICRVEALMAEKKQIFGIQWHPEVSHSLEGGRVFENFNRICST
jgi:GMP synthase (glutamine-hydrolysing)